VKKKVFSAVRVGQQIVPLEVEISTTRAMLPRFTLLGLSGKQGEECKQRVLSALRQSGVLLPHTRLTVNLLPVDVPKSGTAHDLAIAIAILQTYSFIPTTTCAAIGELGLDGEIRKPEGMYGFLGSFLDESHDIWIPPLELPATLIDRFGSKLKPVSNLREVIEISQNIRSTRILEPFTLSRPSQTEIFPTHYSQGLLRVLELCLTGNHHTLLIGSPGLGKSHTKNLLEGLLPNLSLEQSWARQQVLPAPTWCPQLDRVKALDQATTVFQLLGNEKKSGAIFNLQYGVLFLDELPHFRKVLLQSLRRVLEKKATLTQPLSPLWWPHFVAVATCNPCPCSYYGSKKCRCSEEQIKKYFQQISGPLWDRFDVCWRVGTQDIKPMSLADWSEVQTRIRHARHCQEKRAQQTPGLPQFAGQYQWEHLHTCFADDSLFEAFFSNQGSWRKSIQQARLACTLADLQQEKVGHEHLELARFFQMELI